MDGILGGLRIVEGSAFVAHRHHLIMINLVGRRDGVSEVYCTVNSQIGFPFMTGPTGSLAPVNHVLPAGDLITGQMVAAGMRRSGHCTMKASSRDRHKASRRGMAIISNRH